jgi:hypothetical protein
MVRKSRETAFFMVARNIGWFSVCNLLQAALLALELSGGF